MTDEDIQEVKEQIITSLKVLSDDQIIFLQSQHVRKLFDAYLAQGFNSEQALQFICSSLSKLTQQ